MIKVEWETFENFVTSRGLDILMVEDSNFYYLWATEGGFTVRCEIDKNASDQTIVDHFEFAHKASCNPKRSDIENSQIVRVKYCKLGWNYLSKTFEIETSNISSLFTQNYSTACSSVTAKFLKSDLTEISTQEEADLSCELTQIDFFPSWTYELLGGRLRQMENPASPVRVFVRAAPTIPANMGGSKDFIANFNLQFSGPYSELVSDGRASKLIEFVDGTDANRLRFLLKHPAGFKHKIQITLELFKSMKIIIGFSTKPDNRLSKWIRKIDKSPFSHCYLCVDSHVTGQPMIYEASNLSVMSLSLKEFIKNNEIVDKFTMTLTIDEYKEVIKYTEDSLGTPYGMMTLIGIGIARLFNMRRNPFADNNKTLHCSEFIDHICAILGMQPHDPDMVTPKDVYEKLIKRERG